MTFAFPDITVTTWRRDEQGRQVWRARGEDRVAEFVADRTAAVQVLHARGLKALGLNQGAVEVPHRNV